MKVKLGCIIQGDIRRGTNLVLEYMANRFDVVILSTWEDNVKEIEHIKGIEIIVNEKPNQNGLNHRNLQRLTTSNGLKKAKELGCTHILKWRTDMIPTDLDVEQLLAWSRYDVPAGFPSRIVTSAYRNYTVKRDWFSSIPDLFAFGHITMIELLWSDDNFNYNLVRNVPESMLKEEGGEWINDDTSGGIWCPESELYAIFKDRIQRLTTESFNHEVIAKRFFRLFNHEKLKIIWFGKDQGFRPIFQAKEHSWWTEAMWKSEAPVKMGKFAYKTNGILTMIIVKLSSLLAYPELFRQQRYYKRIIKIIKEKI